MGTPNPFDLITGGPPSATSVPLDPGTQKIVHDQYVQASDPNLGAKITAGSEQGANAVLGGGKTVDQQAASSGWQNPAMLQAIRNQYQNAAKGGISQVMKTAANQLPFQRDQMTTRAAGSALAMNNIEMQNNEMQMEAQFNAEIARAQVLQAILGGVGMGMGYKMAGMKGKKAPAAAAEPNDMQMENQISQSGNNYGTGF
jgi:hypothetical protein